MSFIHICVYKIKIRKRLYEKSSSYYNIKQILSIVMRIKFVRIKYYLKIQFISIFLEVIY